MADVGDFDADFVAGGAEGRGVWFADEEDVAGVEGEEFGDVGDELGDRADEGGGADVGAEDVVDQDVDSKSDWDGGAGTDGPMEQKESEQRSRRAGR